VDIAVSGASGCGSARYNARYVALSGRERNSTAASAGWPRVPCSPRVLRTTIRRLLPITVPLAELERAQANSGVIPAIEEQLQVGTRAVEDGRIQIHKTVETSESLIDEPLLEQNYEIEEYR
jgi:uncharacterized protein DUF2382